MSRHRHGHFGHRRHGHGHGHRHRHHGGFGVGVYGRLHSPKTLGGAARFVLLFLGSAVFMFGVVIYGCMILSHHIHLHPTIPVRQITQQPTPTHKLVGLDPTEVHDDTDTDAGADTEGCYNQEGEQVAASCRGERAKWRRLHDHRAEDEGHEEGLEGEDDSE